MTYEIKEMIQKHIVEPAPTTPSFLSPLFLIKKNSKKSRVIFNLKALNRYMMPRHFHLFRYQQMPEFLQPADWMVKLDLSQAYYHIPIKQEHRRFLRISYNGFLLQMTCLPFGLASAPRMFATVTNWTAEMLRMKGLRLVVYLDDYLIVHQCKTTLRTQVMMAIKFLTSLGWCLNTEKSVTTPRRTVEFLGIHWDTDTNTASLPPEKVSRIRHHLLSLLAAGSWTLKQAQRLLGCLNFATFITHRGRLHCRTLQRHCNLLRKEPLETTRFSEEVSIELEWWLENINQQRPIHPVDKPVNYLITDASDIQWGAVVNNKNIHGVWSPHQRRWHCNLKEMYAVIAAITAQGSVLRKSSVIVQSDNKTVVSYVKNEGGTKSLPLLELTKQLLALVDDLDVVLVPHYLPGIYNVEADGLSRNRTASEWHLKQVEYQRIFSLWGTPEIDLFASKHAYVVPNYVTRDFSDSNACYHDAFSKSWTYHLAWIFPPPGLIPRVLRHLNKAEGRYIIIAPRWTKPFWRPDLKRRALKRPTKIRNLERNLVDTFTGRPPTRVSSLHLEAWLISGGTH
ncbi:uncharacterized protein LOC120632649 [Pararge aegeria]|uniref:Jg4320 protein n=1 Tax=Pararge aegeria aegeria TaxID=348720 RepID=A0A8S4QWF3_9NEOP|nr:uncharacterized protein LOC120632649 [Pararge aegeria]CAH2226525.1 jg4320 [Pararge aegeria aegeria]